MDQEERIKRNISRGTYHEEWIMRNGSRGGSRESDQEEQIKRNRSRAINQDNVSR